MESLPKHMTVSGINHTKISFFDSMTTRRKPKIVKADNRTKQKIFARMGATRGFLTIGNITIKVNRAEMKRVFPNHPLLEN